MTEVATVRHILNSLDEGLGGVVVTPNLDHLRRCTKDVNFAALVDEAAKRYATTESRIRVAWNNIKDAAITAGSALLPIMAGIASKVASLASAFGSLPGPVRGAILGLLAIVAAGGLIVGAALKIVTSLVAARAAMTALGVSSSPAAAAMGAIGKAGVIGLAIAGASVTASNLAHRRRRQR